jgi:hypothetical protein
MFGTGAGAGLPISQERDEVAFGKVIQVIQQIAAIGMFAGFTLPFASATTRVSRRAVQWVDRIVPVVAETSTCLVEGFPIMVGAP